jgi:hypothetical protein
LISFEIPNKKIKNYFIQDFFALFISFVYSKRASLSQEFIFCFKASSVCLKISLFSQFIIFSKSSALFKEFL